MSKTILLIRNAARGDFGGAETYQLSVARILKETGYHPIIITRSPKLIDYARKNSIEHIKGWWWSRQNWTGKSTFLLPFYAFWQMLLVVWYTLLIIRTRAQALHIQSRDDFIAATIAGRIMGRKTIWTDHMDLRYIFENIEQPFRNIVGKIVYCAGMLAHHIILISDNEYRLVTSHFNAKSKLHKRIIIIKNGVIDSKPARKTRSTFPDGTSFCLASRIVENKGIGEAIEAFEIVQKELPEKKLQLNIYGDGPDMSRYQRIAQDNPSIIFHGHQPDILDCVASNDVYILPSYQEGFSIALLEATMLGMAIIATAVDSNEEIILNNHSGLTVGVKNSPELADAMKSLAVDPGLKKRLGNNARKDFEKNYDLHNIVTNQIVPLY